jgi:hypothetical protein
LVRRAVWTADYIYIARPGDDTVIDMISLADTDEINVSEDLNAAAQIIPSGPQQHSNDHDHKRDTRRVYPTDSDDRDSLSPKDSALALNQEQGGRKPHSDPKSFMKEKLIKPLDKAAVLEVMTLPGGFNSGTSRRPPPPPRPP